MGVRTIIFKIKSEVYRLTFFNDKCQLFPHVSSKNIIEQSSLSFRKSVLPLKKKTMSIYCDFFSWCLFYPHYVTVYNKIHCSGLYFLSMELITLGEFQTQRTWQQQWGLFVRKQILIAGDNISIVSEYHMQSKLHSLFHTISYSASSKDHKVEMNIISTHIIFLLLWPPRGLWQILNVSHNM